MNKKYKYISIIAIIFIALSSILLFRNDNSYKDGIYKVYGSTYSYYNYKPFAIVEVKNNRLIDAVLNYVDKDGNLITTNRELKQEINKETGTFPLAFTQELKSEFLLSQGTSNFSKTISYTDGADIFKKLLNKLIEERILVGDNSPLEVNLK